MQLGGDIIVLDEGRVLQQGPAHEIFENPANTRIAEISNDPAMNLLCGAIEGGKIVIGGDIKLAVPAHFKSLTSGTYTFGIRASDVSLNEKGLPFKVELAEISGSETLLHVQSGGHTIVSLLDMVQNFDAGDVVNLKLNESSLYAFGKDGALISSPFAGGL